LKKTKNYWINYIHKKEVKFVKIKVKIMKKSKVLYEGDPGLALITGAAGGIGSSFAEKLAGEGFDLILVDMRENALIEFAEKLKKEKGIKVETIVADLSIKEYILGIERRIKEGKNLTMLINNAGFGIKDGYLATTPIEKQLEMINVHNIAPTRFIVAALPNMIENNRGDIINVSSLLARIPLMGNALYCATKSYLIKLTETLHLETYDTKLRVQVLLPGFVLTGFHEAMGDDMSTGEWDKYPWMDPEEVVEDSIEGLLNGKVICLPGKKTRHFWWKIRLVPRKWRYKMSIKQSKKSEESEKRLKDETRKKD